MNQNFVINRINLNNINNNNNSIIYRNIDNEN